MGLLSRPAVEPDVSNKSSTESRWLFPLRRFEEDLLEHILMSASSAPWCGRRGKDDASQQPSFVGTSVKERPMKDLMQRKFEKLGKNVFGKVKTLKQVFTDSHEKGADREQPASSRRDECRKVACNEIVWATLHRHPGSQLPDVFVSTLQSHFDALPTSYAKAGFNSEQVFTHIRLLEQAKLELPGVPVVSLQAVDCTGRSSNGSEFSSTASSPSSSVWEETERGLSEEAIDVVFACNTPISKPALLWAFEHEAMIVKQAHVYERKGICLGVLSIHASREKSQQDFVRRVIKSAVRKSRFAKFSLALCGCEVPGLYDHPDNRSSCSRKEQATTSTTDDCSDAKDNYWNEADFNFTSTSFIDSSNFKEQAWNEEFNFTPSFLSTGYGYGSYGYPVPDESYGTQAVVCTLPDGGCALPARTS